MATSDIARSLRILAYLLAYPGAEWRRNLPALREALQAERAIAPRRRTEIERLIETLMRADGIEAEAAYVQLFDRGRATSLHLFEHVHGDSRDRGPAMIDLEKTYQQAGLLLAPGELPDYLPAVLEFVSTQPPREGRAFLSELAHILTALFSALSQRQSAYASVLGALLELAGEKAQPVKLPPEEPLDASWAEPPAFAGCSSHGQAPPGQPQPIQIVRRDPRAQGAAA